MNRGQRLDGFQLYHDQPLDEQVWPEPFVESQSVKIKRHRFICLHAQTAPLQFLDEQDLIDRFEQTWPESRMQFVRRIDNLPSDLV